MKLGPVLAVLISSFGIFMVGCATESQDPENAATSVEENDAPLTDEEQRGVGSQEPDQDVSMGDACEPRHPCSNAEIRAAQGRCRTQCAPRPSRGIQYCYSYGPMCGVSSVCVCG